MNRWLLVPRRKESKSRPHLGSTSHTSRGPHQGFGKRHNLILLLFLGFSCIYAMRVNLSVAIVAMVKTHARTPRARSCCTAASQTSAPPRRRRRRPGRTNSRLGKVKLQGLEVPWHSILTSVPFLVVVVSHIGHNWGLYCLLTELPTYLKNVQHFDMKQIPPQLLDTIHFPEEYMGALRITMMAVDIRKCFKLIFEDDTFRQVDLFNPKPKRSRRFFALIYDFLVFTDSVFNEVEEREEKVGALVEQRDKMRAKLHKMKQQIHERRIENEKNQLAKEEDMRRVEAKTEELQRCQEEKVALKAQLDALGLSLAKLDMAIKDTELRTMEAGTEKQRLEGLVIQASEEQEIKKRDEKLAVLKEDNQKKKDHLAQLQQRASFISATKEKLDKLIAMFQEIQLEKSKEKDIQATIQKRVSQVAELQEEIKDQEQSNLQLIQQVTASESKVQHIHHAWDLKQESLNKEIKEQKQVLEDLERNQTEQDIVCKEVSEDVADLEEQIRQRMEEVRNTNIMIKSNYKLILDAMEEGNVELMSALTEATKCVEEFRSTGDSSP